MASALEKVTDKGKFLKTTFKPWDHGVPTFINRRDTYARVDLEKGHYVIIPCTFDPGRRQTFALSVFSERRTKVWEILSDQEHGCYAEWSDMTAGGPPDVNEMKRADKVHVRLLSFVSLNFALLAWLRKRLLQQSENLSCLQEQKKSC